jgi:iron(III) transport system ATP-binding protein
MIAGFYRPDGGELRFEGAVVNEQPPNRRNTGMVFQNYALWPHMTVARNVEYGLKIRKLNADQRRERVAEVLETVQMQRYADRMPNQLSGGQQQRVALARALVIRPGILLLDEPLSNLDAKLRLEMRDEIRRIHQTTGITALYVTHDQKEALSLADRMAILRDGRVEQIGTPREVYRNPANRFVADFMGEANFIGGRPVGQEDGRWVLETRLGRIVAAGREGRSLPGGDVSVGIRPESFVFAPGGENRFRFRIEGVTYLGEVEQYRLTGPGGIELKAVEQNPRVVRDPGDEIELGVDPEDVLVLTG